MNRVCIYVLGLEQGKYYIGRSLDPKSRIETHMNSEGSIWTKMYKPVASKIIYDCNTFEEDMYTVMYMAKYGIDNVRGGSFVTINLDSSTKYFLQKMINNAQDKCFGCGSSNHYVASCDSIKSDAVTNTNSAVSDITTSIVPVSTTPIVSTTTESIVSDTTIGIVLATTESIVQDTTIPIVPATTEYVVPDTTIGIVPTITESIVPVTTESIIIKLNATCPKYICTKCGRNTHNTAGCYARTHINGSNITICCNRCGRNSHSESSCYATYHANGHYIG